MNKVFSEKHTNFSAKILLGVPFICLYVLILSFQRFIQRLPVFFFKKKDVLEGNMKKNPDFLQVVLKKMLYLHTEICVLVCP